MRARPSSLVAVFVLSMAVACDSEGSSTNEGLAEHAPVTESPSEGATNMDMAADAATAAVSAERADAPSGMSSDASMAQPADARPDGRSASGRAQGNQANAESPDDANDTDDAGIATSSGSSPQGSQTAEDRTQAGSTVGSATDAGHAPTTTPDSAAGAGGIGNVEPGAMGGAGGSSAPMAGGGSETAGAGGVGGAMDTTRTPGAGGFGGGEPFCIHPPSCVPVLTATVGMETCCPNNGEPCGYSVLYPENLDDGTCRPNSAVFLELPGQDEQRISTEGAPDQLITPDCGTRGLLSFPLPGCCMQDNRCGVSTYQIADILLLLGGIPAPFTRVECVRVETLNAQFRVTPLAGMGQLPPSNDTCDYADLDARLPQNNTSAP